LTVVFLHDFRVFDDSPKLTKNGVVDVDFFSDHVFLFVVGVVGVAEEAVALELKLQELMPELPLVTHVVSDVELVVGGVCAAVGFDLLLCVRLVRLRR